MEEMLNSHDSLCKWLLPCIVLDLNLFFQRLPPLEVTEFMHTLRIILGCVPVSPLHVVPRCCTGSFSHPVSCSTWKRGTLPKMPELKAGTFMSFIPAGNSAWSCHHLVEL